MMLITVQRRVQGCDSRHVLGEEVTIFWICFLEVLNFLFYTMSTTEELPPSIMSHSTSSPRLSPQVCGEQEERPSTHCRAQTSSPCAGTTVLSSPGTKGKAENTAVSQGSPRQHPKPHDKPESSEANSCLLNKGTQNRSNLENI